MQPRLYAQQLIKDNVVISAFTETFPFDSYDPVKEVNNRLDVGNIADYQTQNPVWKVSIEPSDKELMDYMSSPITMLTSFFGIPNRFTYDCKEHGGNVEKSGGQTWENIKKQILFIPKPDATPVDIFFSGVASAFYLTFIFLFKMLPTTLMNVIKLFTEFPLTLARDFCVRNQDHSNIVLKHLAVTGLVLSNSLLFMVRAITSPVKNARAAWNLEPHSRVNYLLAGLSVALTVTVYTLVFPLGLKFLATQALPWVAGKAAGPIAKAAIGAAKAIASFAKWISTTPTPVAIGSKLGPILNPVVQTVGLSLTNGAIGGGFFMTPILLGVNFIFSKYKNELLNRHNKDIYQIAAKSHIDEAHIAYAPRPQQPANTPQEQPRPPAPVIDMNSIPEETDEVNEQVNDVTPTLVNNDMTYTGVTDTGGATFTSYLPTVNVSTSSPNTPSQPKGWPYLWSESTITPTRDTPNPTTKPGLGMISRQNTTNFVTPLTAKRGNQ